MAVRRRGGHGGPPWQDYVHRFHADRPAITEALLAGSRVPDVGSPYEWLVTGVAQLRGVRSPTDVWLDLGCGSCPVYPLLPALRFVGLDVSSAELAAARALGRGPVVRGSATRIPLAASVADVVVASMSLMLIHPLDQALHEAARVARPAAPLGIILPTGWPVAARDAAVLAALAVGLRRVPSPGQVLEFSLPRMLDAAGFTVVSNRARRFARPLRSEQDARLVVDSLYLPGVSPFRQDAAVAALSRVSGPGVQFPVPIRRVLARRVPAPPAREPQRTRGRA